MDYNEYLSKITDLFNTEFTASYKSCRTRNKNKLLKYIICFFRRWYYSALIEGTIVTPDNLIKGLNKQCGKPLSLFPCFKPDNPAKPEVYSFYVKEYALKNHPVVNDLKIFMDSCVPDVEVDESGIVTEEHSNQLLQSLSIYDPFYVEYLNMIAIELGLLNETPSIYSSRFHVSPNYKKLFKLTSREIFNKIFQATVSTCANSINEILPVNQKLVNKNFILDHLKKPTSTDEIFQTIYDSLGIGIDGFLEYVDEDDEDDVDEFYNMVMSSTFLLGVAIDKYFYTPFGFYLRIISPEYLIPCDLPGDITFALESMKQGDSMDLSLFSPCSNYHLTCLGAEYFDIPKDKLYLPEFPDKIPFEVILNIALNYSSEIPEDVILKYFEPDKISSLPTNIYEIKIKFDDFKTYWKNIEVPSTDTLDDLYVEICYALDFRAVGDYCFYADLSENAFTRYSPPTSKHCSKQTTDVSLEELGFPKSHKFMLVLHNTVIPYISGQAQQKITKLQLEIMNKKDRKLKTLYPRISRISEAFKAIERQTEF